ncbi:four helix bundle protein [Mesorhizobium sp. B2-3-8]|uniref:four helix bundle protein n=1 Tax=unclassified Mesorhizobium TaxID=325217 RepID=UPI0032B1769F
MAEKTGSYKDLLVWQQAMDLAVAVYSSTKSWPKEELYGLTSQVRRSASSVPANIAEGYVEKFEDPTNSFFASPRDH